MEFRPLGDLTLSTLTLGTCQFGLPYGIANVHGQPSYETSRDIIACAVEGGVNVLDTAAAYGESEAVLGRALAELGIADRVNVVSKIPWMADDFSPADADAFIEKSLTEMLQRLRLDYLPICLFHSEDNARYLDSLMKMKERGLVGHVGVSVTTPGMTARLIDEGQVEAIQIPTSMLDQRWIRQGLVAGAKAKGIALFVRSVYLQGLIPMPEADILPELAEVIPVLRKLNALAREAGMTITELAMRFVYTLDGVISLVVGMETLEQIRENLALFSHGPLSADLLQAVMQAVPDLSEKIIFPRHWSKRMPDSTPAKR